MAKNKVYLQSHFYASPHDAARCLLDLPRHVVQVTLIAVAPSKATVVRMMEAHVRYPRPGWAREMRVNDSFTTWRELSGQGILSLAEPGLWMTESRARTLVAMLPDDQAQVVARGELVDTVEGPLYVRWRSL